MSYVGLARKYRPQTFDEVVGQQETAITLQNAIRSNRVHHAYLFAGGKGVGKTSMARIFAKSLNCVQGPTVTPCNQCELCQRISTGEDIDVVEIDGASNRGIDEIRNIKENIKYLTSRARYKIFIIDEVHMLTQAAFNALLKTLEEPPLHVKFIMATTQITSIPDTILSRCQRFTFKNIDIVDIVKRLQEIAGKENIKVDPATTEKIAFTAGGALRDSLVLFEQLASYTNGNIDAQSVSTLLGNMGERGCKLIEIIRDRNALDLLTLLRDFFGQGGDPSQLVEELIHKLRDILVANAAQGTDKMVEGADSYRQWVAQQSGKFTPEFLTMAIYQLLEAKTLIHRSMMGRVVMETVLLKLLRSESLWPLHKIEQTLVQLDDKLSKMKLPVGAMAYAGKGNEARSAPLQVAPAPSPTPQFAPPQMPKPEPRPPAPPKNEQPPLPAEMPEMPNMEDDEEVPPAVVVGMEAFEKLPRVTLPPATPKPQAPTAIQSAASKPIAATNKEVAPAAQEKPARRSKPGMPAAPTAPIETPVAAAQAPAEVVAANTSLPPWERFLEAIKSKMPRQVDLLRMQAKAVVADRQLVITLPGQLRISEKIFANPENKTFVQDVGQQIFGKGFALRFEFIEDKSGAPLAMPARPEDKVKNDPLVKKTMELFEGRISQVKKVVAPAAPEAPASAPVESAPVSEEENE